MTNLDPVTSDSDRPMTECIACRHKIPDGATLCSHCRSHQAAWKNIANFIAATLGIVTISFGAAAFIVSKYPEFMREFFPARDLRVLTFYDTGIVAIANKGDQEVYLDSIFIEALREPEVEESRFTWSRGLYRAVPPGDLITITYEGKLPNHPDGLFTTRFSGDAHWLARLGVAKPITSQDGCWFYRFASRDHQLVRQYRDFDEEGFREFEVKASLHYFLRDADEMQSMDIPATGYLVKSNSEECANP